MNPGDKQLPFLRVVEADAELLSVVQVVHVPPKNLTSVRHQHSTVTDRAAKVDGHPLSTARIRIYTLPLSSSTLLRADSAIRRKRAMRSS